VDYDYLKTMDIKITEGRFFSKEFPADASRTFNAWVINEKAVEKMGLKDPIGKEYSLSFSNGMAPGRIIGVFKNFHNEPLHDEIRPLTLILGSPSNFSFMCIRIRSDNISGTIRSIERRIKKIVPDYLVEYHFLNDELNTLYKTERLTNTIMIWATSLAIFISCLGLFGLVSFSSERRTKEIGIRKVLGASISGIVLLQSRDFSKWVIFANVFAWPVSWYAMNKWLQSFPYRISMSWWTFLLAGALAMVIALLTVTYQATKAAFSNPIEALRYE
jgi:putative ABC transport system permease protein